METEVSVAANKVENKAANKWRRVEKEPQATPVGLDFISNLPDDMLRFIIVGFRVPAKPLRFEH